jgi:hypothetical protein
VSRLANTFIHRVDVFNRGYEDLYSRVASEVADVVFHDLIVRRPALIVVWVGNADARTVATGQNEDDEEVIAPSEFSENLESVSLIVS